MKMNLMLYLRAYVLWENAGLKTELKLSRTEIQAAGALWWSAS